MLLSIRRSFYLALLALITTMLSSSAQSPGSPAAQQPASPASPALRVTTRLVVVDVVAVDHKGAPVTDLQEEDFSLLEDGSAQKIRVFNFQQPTANETAVPPMKMPETMTS